MDDFIFRMSARGLEKHFSVAIVRGKLLQTTFPARRGNQVSSSLRAENPAEFTTLKVCPFYFKNLDWIETRIVLIILSVASVQDTFHRVEIIQRSFVLLFLRLCF